MRFFIDDFQKVFARSITNTVKTPWPLLKNYKSDLFGAYPKFSRGSARNRQTKLLRSHAPSICRTTIENYDTDSRNNRKNSVLVIPSGEILGARTSRASNNYYSWRNIFRDGDKALTSHTKGKKPRLGKSRSINNISGVPQFN